MSRSRRTERPRRPERARRPGTGARRGGRRATGRDPVNSTKIADQPALTTSHGTSWLVIGALLGFIAIGTLSFVTTLAPLAAATGGLVVIVLYAVMVAVRLRSPAGHTRLVALAWLLGGMGAAAFAAVMIAAASVQAA